MTRFGMVEADFTELASLVADAVIRSNNVKSKATEYRMNFREMKYCLPQRDACELGARVLESVFPTNEYARRFADNLVAVSSAAG